MLIGIDDTDSKKGMCTTYLAALLCEKLGTTHYPQLIRLNPNIPYKTRGNGAVALNVAGNSGETLKIKETVLETVKKYAHLRDKKTNPGVAFIEDPNDEDKKSLNDFYQRAVSELVTIKEAEEVARSANAEIHKFKCGRGIIGALAAIGAGFSDSLGHLGPLGPLDKTYELIAYRTEKNCGRGKKIDEGSVFEMNEKTYPQTFDNIDLSTGQILITPHGDDPVFCGIRGNSTAIVKKAWGILRPLEEIERTQIFETNQGTDAHLRKREISELKPYDCAILEGDVTVDPQGIEGGHVIFEFSDNTGSMACAAYRPTGQFRNIVKKLRTGDHLRVYGGIGKYKKTLNLEKIEILKLEKSYEMEIPMHCERKMTSAGKGKGFKCRKCGKWVGEKDIVVKGIPRELTQGFYEVPPRARRHLSMPLVRMEGRD